MKTQTFLLFFVVCFNQMLQIASQECQVVTTTTTKNCGENNGIENLPTSQFARGKKGPKGLYSILLNTYTNVSSFLRIIKNHCSFFKNFKFIFRL